MSRKTVFTSLSLIFALILSACPKQTETEPKTEPKTVPKEVPPKSAKLEIEEEITDTGRVDYRLCTSEEFEPQKGINFFKLKQMLTEMKIVSKVDLAKAINDAIHAEENQSDNSKNGVNYVLAYDSKSLQHASPEKPRMVLFSEREAKKGAFPRPPGGYGNIIDFAAAFSGFEEDNFVEILEFNYKHNRFCSRVIKIEKDRLSFISHPNACIRCHTTDIRPNWEPYPLWPRFFDSTNGNLDERKDAEHKHYIDFMNRVHKDDIYAAISNKEGLAHVLKNISRGQGLIDTRKTVTSINAKVSEGLQKVNFLRIARMLSETKDHASYRYAYLAAILNCTKIESYLPPKLAANHKLSYEQVVEDTKRAIDIAYQTRIDEIRKLTTFEHPIGNNEDSTVNIETIAKLRYLLENRTEAISMADWSMSFLFDAYGFFSNQISIADLNLAYSQVAFKDEPEIQDSVAEIRHRMESYSYPVQFTAKGDRHQLCSTLLAKSLNSLKSL